MPRKQRFLKFCILLMTPITVIAAFGAFTGTFWFSFSGEKYLSAVDSPSGHFRAVLVEEHDNQCINSEGIPEYCVSLRLERHAWLLKTGEFTPFYAAKSAADGLSMRWSGPNRLFIDCPKCTGESFDFYGGNWGEATFQLKIPAQP
jgi:hypothetical protein